MKQQLSPYRAGLDNYSVEFGISPEAVDALFLGLAAAEACRSDWSRKSIYEQARDFTTKVGRLRSVSYIQHAEYREQVSAAAVTRLKTLLMHGFNLHAGNASISKNLWRPLADIIFALKYEAPPSNAAEDTDETNILYKRLRDRERELTTRRSSRGRRDEQTYRTLDKEPTSKREFRRAAGEAFAAALRAVTARGGMRRRVRGNLP